MSNKQTTAVEFLIEKFRETIGDLIIKAMQEEIEEAKAIERNQIEDAYKEAACNILGEEVCPIDECNGAWEYYENTFTSTFITE